MIHAALIFATLIGSQDSVLVGSRAPNPELIARLRALDSEAKPPELVVEVGSKTRVYWDAKDPEYASCEEAAKVFDGLAKQLDTSKSTKLKVAEMSPEARTSMKDIFTGRFAVTDDTEVAVAPGVHATASVEGRRLSLTMSAPIDEPRESMIISDSPRAGMPHGVFEDFLPDYRRHVSVLDVENPDNSTDLAKAAIDAFDRAVAAKRAKAVDAMCSFFRTLARVAKAQRLGDILDSQPRLDSDVVESNLRHSLHGRWKALGFESSSDALAAFRNGKNANFDMALTFRIVGKDAQGNREAAEFIFVAAWPRKPIGPSSTARS